MNLRTEFTKPECDWFRATCNFTPQELEIFNMRVQDKSIIEICMTLQMFEATVGRRIRNIKRKIHKVL